MLVFGGGDEGGGPAYLKSFLKNLDKKRFEVVYVSLGRDSLSKELEGHVSSVEILVGWRGSLFLSALGVYRALKMYNPDVIHTHGLRANLAGRLAGRAKGVPVVTTVHSAISRDYANALKQFWAPRIDNLTLSLTDRFIVVSEAIKEDLVNRGMPPENISIVYNGVDIPGERPPSSDGRTRIGLYAEQFVVGTVARLEPNKGIKYLIRAAKELKPKLANVKVVVIGAGRDRQELERESERLGLTDIIDFLGFREDARSLMTSFDVFTLPSLMEGFALVVIEAMAAGIPVVASKVGGVPEIIQDGRNGLLVEPGDPRSLAEAIFKLQESPDLRSMIVAEAYKDFNDRFTTERFVTETENVLEETAMAVRKGIAVP